MARRGSSSNSFLRSKDLIAFSEISHDKEGNNILKNRVLAEALARDESGKFIRNKANIANILNRYGVVYRMVFNAMNMEHYSYSDIEEALEHLADYIHDLGVSGIVEFHASDKTQNSDHIHFWISSEDTIIYNKIAQEMVAMGYSNIEDVYIQKYEDNRKLDEKEYVNDKNSSIEERFPTQQKKIEVEDKKSTPLSTIRLRYNLVIENIGNLFRKVVTINKEDNIVDKNISIVEECTLPQTDEIVGILSRIKELKREIE